ncbi:MAG: hypothetical protein R2854_10605 [Caldilineaceae bacterium]
MDGSVEYKTYGAQVGELVAEAADEHSQLALFLPTDAARGVSHPRAAGHHQKHRRKISSTLCRRRIETHHG